MADDFKKISPEDEGELTIMCYIENDNIILNFRKDVTWLGLGVDHARHIANVLNERADELEAKLNG